MSGRSRPRRKRMHRPRSPRRPRRRPARPSPARRWSAAGPSPLTVNAKGVELTGEGRFQSQGPVEPPLFQIDLKAKGKGEQPRRRRGVRRQDRLPGGRRQGGGRAGEGLERPRGAPCAIARRAPPTEEDFSGYSTQMLDAFKLRGQDTVDGTAVLHFRAPYPVGGDPRRLREPGGAPEADEPALGTSAPAGPHGDGRHARRVGGRRRPHGAQAAGQHQVRRRDLHGRHPALRHQ